MPSKVRKTMATLTTIEGVLERIVYVNEETSYTVARLQEKGRKELTTVVGKLISVAPGETLRLEGSWVRDKKYGEQFRVENYCSIVPASLNGIEKYLGSGMIKGIGAVMARRIVKKFGLETLEIIEDNPRKLLEVEGIGEFRLSKITQAWEAHKEIKEVMIFLQGHGVSSNYAIKIYKHYGKDSIRVVRENPYRLAAEISGIGFKQADKIARNLGLELNSVIRAEAGVIFVLNQLSNEGHVYYPREGLIKKSQKLLDIEDKEIIEQAIFELTAQDRVKIEELPGGEEAVYLKPLFIAEESSAGQLKALISTPLLPIQIDLVKALAWVKRQSRISLSPEQKLAIEKAVGSKVMIITGGPGTGKTTIVNSIIRILERKGQRILLAAPTGRAAKRLSDTTGRPAKTIHRLLEYSPQKGGFQRNRENPLPADLIIVDEASMIDILLLNHLLKAIPLPARLILVGDIDQLPSVGPGNVLKDIINSQQVEVVKLTEIFRQARESLIVVNAHRVNSGVLPRIKEDEEAGLSEFYFIEREEPERALEAVLELVSRRIPDRFGFDPMEQTQVLSPMHRGLLGVENLNFELQQRLNPNGQELVRGARRFRIRDKVIQSINNYEKEVFNGDIGIIEGIDLEEQELSVRFDGRVVGYDFSELDELMLAYAISVHKSQGNEYPAVVIPLLTQHYLLLQRNLLYTAITRAKRLVVIVGVKKALTMAVKNARVKQRYTLLGTRLGAG